ncbi:GvpL/GvpF family gas vesicle protein, partial [Cellulosimicrobium cellulans]|uniref:GvpL/GvpF family gas vesicle protein n=1 Tax=Cellulosimicrobium cellulans TaxID=1710 RepID=UPI001495F872
MTEPGLYLYLVAAGTPGTLGTGVDGAPLSLVTGPTGLSAVVHEHTAGPFEGPDDVVRRRVLEHSDVVDRIWQAGSTVLPASFNVIVAPAPGAPARERLVRWLTDRDAELSARVGALRGRVELRVGVGLALDVVAGEHPDLADVPAEL